MKKIDVYYSVVSGGDGSAYPHWFLTDQDASDDQYLSVEEYNEGWGECCTGRVETYIGSNVHSEAISNSSRIPERKAAIEKKKG